MTKSNLAYKAYAQAAAPIRTPKGTEYDIFARVTHKIKAAAQKGKLGFGELASALHDNRKLWVLLASDVADKDNGLPQDLRARIFYLAEFTEHQSRKVLRENASVRPLLEVNMAMMRGLRQGSLPK